MVSFLQTAKAVHALEPSTHWIHEATLAERLRISTDDLEGWTKCVREGGSGAVSNNTFKANPEPYNVKIDLLDLSADNTFNLYYQVNRSNNTSKQNEVAVLFRPAKYYFIGTSESSRSTSLMTEIEIARYVVGEHKELSKNVYKSIGARRRRLWRQWMSGDEEGDSYYIQDLPVIALFFADYFGVKQDRIPPSVLARVKEQIHDILVALNVLTTSDIPRVITRRSMRLSGDSQDTEVEGIASERVRRQHVADTQRSNSPAEISQSDDSLDDILGNNDSADEDDMTQQASFTALKNAGLRRAGVLEAAFKCAHADGTINELNVTLFALNCPGPDLMHADEFKHIAALKKTRLVRLIKNFDKLKDEINKTQLFQISRDKLLLEWQHDAHRYSNGESLPQKIRDNQGHLKPEIA